MIAQRIYIPQYDWRVKILYDARPCDTDYILENLYDMGCERRHLFKAERLMRSGVNNEGLTFSNEHERKTLIVVGHASDLFAAFNTLEHEVNHLEMHICKKNGIDPYSEEAAYLAGDIKETIARNAWYAMRRMFLDFI